MNTEYLKGQRMSHCGSELSMVKEVNRLMFTCVDSDYGENLTELAICEKSAGIRNNVNLKGYKQYLLYK